MMGFLGFSICGKIKKLSNIKLLSLRVEGGTRTHDIQNHNLTL